MKYRLQPVWCQDTSQGTANVIMTVADNQGHLIKAYDVTIQGYRKSLTKIKYSRMHIDILRGVESLTAYDILELWHLTS